MKTVNVPQIGGLDDLLAVLAEPDRFKKHLEQLKSALQELQDAAGGVATLREADKLHNLAKTAMVKADAALTAAREEADSIRSQVAHEFNNAQSVKNDLAERSRVLAKERDELDREKENLSRAKAAWEEEEAARKSDLETLAENTEQRSRYVAKRDAAMRKNLKNAAAAMDA